jgi:hypothetical protein
MAKNKTITVKGTEITIIQYKDADYLSMRYGQKFLRWACAYRKVA